MRKFTIIARPTGATYPTIPEFVRTFPAESKALAIKQFFQHFGPFNYIVKVIELKEEEAL